MEKNLKKKTDICITNLICYTPETLQINYTSKKVKIENNNS